MKPCKIIGLNDVSGSHYNSSIALVVDGELVFAVSEERFTRVKYDLVFPQNAIQAACDYAGLDINDIDYFAVGYPASSFYSDLFSRGKLDLFRSLFALRSGLFSLLKYLLPNFKKMYHPRKRHQDSKAMILPESKLVFIDHHLSHASSAYRCSGFDDCLAISMDGFGPNQLGRNIAGQVYQCHNGHMDLVHEIPMHATTLWFSAVTECLELKYMDGEGKTMGLAAYGDPQNCYDALKSLAFHFKDNEWQGYPFWIDFVMVPRRDVFLKTRSARKICALIDRFGKADVAAAAQRLLEERVIEFLQALRGQMSFSRVACAGGTFLNVKMNKLVRECDFITDFFVHPHASDGGTAVGAALELYHQLTGVNPGFKMTDAALGMSFTDEEIRETLDRFSDQIEYEFIGAQIPEFMAGQLNKGKIIGWFQGREEWGPRALGRRSVLADPRNPETRDVINKQMKNRDWFMPFAPSCLAQEGHRYFKSFCPSPFMTMAFDVQSEKCNDIPSAIHVDETARVHSVTEDNPLYYRLIKHFYELTKVPVVLNTSFNRHGLPIVHTPAQAVEHLLWGCFHELAIGGYRVTGKESK